ncbi:MAG: response regulator transcription factor [Clostridiales bacterium]|nr:response regulator transcription factor [Clostridiales bacterium]
MMKTVKVLIADDHPILSAGLKMCIDEWDEFEVCGIAGNGNEAIELSKKTHPDLGIIDLKMPYRDGASAIRILKELMPEMKVLAFTTFEDDETIRAAVSAGCDGLLLKVIDSEALKNSLVSIMNGISVFDESVIEKLRKTIPKKHQITLSDRETLILSAICEGLTNAEIGERLCLSTGTVKNLISLLLNKTNCISRSQLVSFAKDNKLI